MKCSPIVYAVFVFTFFREISRIMIEYFMKYTVSSLSAIRETCGTSNAFADNGRIFLDVCSMFIKLVLKILASHLKIILSVVLAIAHVIYCFVLSDCEQAQCHL